MSSPKKSNPYDRKIDQIEDPPVTGAQIFGRIGPGLILASSIVGSGELIATPVLGAEVGYALLWLVILSCFIKVFVQKELGRYAIATGETTLEAFNGVPGPRLRVSWLLWCWFVMVMFTLMTIGGMLGGIGEVLNRQVPGVSISSWVWIVNFVTVGLLIGGRYVVVEKVAIGLVASFTLMTVGCAIVLLKLPEYFSWSDVLEGLTFKPPEGGLVTAVAVFGITGVGANELIMYPYWCIEKGYARYTGPRDDSAHWNRRAHGWIKVMGVDVLSSMVLYTFATVAFYLLGAGVLNGMGIIPEGSQMVDTLSKIYTQTLGDAALPIFIVGAVAVLYSTVFATTAANARVFADFTGMLGIYDKANFRLRLRVTRIFLFILLFIPSLYFTLLESPVLMVKIGGVAQAAMLPIIAFTAVYLRYRRLPAQLAPPPYASLALWISAVVMAAMMGYSIVQRL